MAIQHLHVAGVDARRKARVVLESGTLSRDRRLGHVGDELHRMGVTHRYQVDLHLLAIEIQFLDAVVHRAAHVDADLSILFQPRADQAAQRLYGDLGLGAQPMGMHELDEAARAVAALLHFTAVGVEDAVAKVGAGRARALDHQDLVAANAEMAICNSPQLLSGQPKRLARVIEHHEIVAPALPLGEGELHSNRRRPSRTSRPTVRARFSARRPSRPSSSTRWRPATAAANAAACSARASPPSCASSVSSIAPPAWRT